MSNREFLDYVTKEWSSIRLINSHAGVQRPTIVQLDQKQHNKVCAQLRVRDHLIHRDMVAPAWLQCKRVMRVPLTKIIVAGIIVFRHIEERTQRSEYLRHYPDESGKRPPLALNGDLFCSERLFGHVLSHEDAANLPFARQRQSAM